MCQQQNVVYSITRKFILIVTTDFGEGNKQMSVRLKNALEGGTVNPYLVFLLPLPDAPHIDKSIKASFSNWHLKLFGEKGCLAFLYTLRKKADIPNAVFQRTIMYATKIDKIPSQFLSYQT